MDSEDQGTTKIITIVTAMICGDVLRPTKELPISAIPNPKNQLKNDIHKIANVSPDRISASELATLLNSQNQDMISHSQISEKEIEGKIVEWELEIMVVASLFEHYHKVLA